MKNNKMQEPATSTENSSFQNKSVMPAQSNSQPSVGSEPKVLKRVNTEENFDIYRDSIEISRPTKNTIKEKLMTIPKFIQRCIGAIGVIYGDIGTSPIYTVASVFLYNNVNYNPNWIEVLGATSIIIYTITIFLCIKYLIFVLEFTHHGEGGIHMLTALLRSKRLQNPTLNLVKKWVLICVSIIGASFVLGDGVLTPAISVLSAVGGIQAFSPSLAPYVLPLALVILILLFFMQALGTNKVGFIFGPIMLLFFLAIGGIGIYNITLNPYSLYAFNPYYIILYTQMNPTRAFTQLGGTLLSITGVEAMFSDCGHFGVAPTRASAFIILFPTVILSYAGQAAWLMERPQDISLIFFLNWPSVLFWPMIVLTTVATVIASQATITAAYSLVAQAIHLNYFPSWKIVYMDQYLQGMVYIPFMNFVLMVLVIICCVLFPSGTTLASAYGICVMHVLSLTSMMILWNIIENRKGHRLLFRVIAFCFILVICLPFELLLLASAYVKVATGGWFALTIAFCYMVVQFLWAFGDAYAASIKSRLKTVSFEDFYKAILFNNRVVRNKGTGIYIVAANELHDEVGVAPFVLQLIDFHRSTFEKIIFLQVKRYATIPVMPIQEQIDFSDYGNHIYRMKIRVGFFEKLPNIDKIIEDSDKAFMFKDRLYFSGFDHFIVDKSAWFFKKWPIKAFVFLYSNSRQSIISNVLPKNVLEIGVRIVLPQNKKKNVYEEPPKGDHALMELQENIPEMRMLLPHEELQDNHGIHPILGGLTANSDNATMNSSLLVKNNGFDDDTTPPIWNYDFAKETVLQQNSLPLEETPPWLVFARKQSTAFPLQKEVLETNLSSLTASGSVDINSSNSNNITDNNNNNNNIGGNAAHENEQFLKYLQSTNVFSQNTGAGSGDGVGDAAEVENMFPTDAGESSGQHRSHASSQTTSRELGTSVSFDGRRRQDNTDNQKSSPAGNSSSYNTRHQNLILSPEIRRARKLSTLSDAGKK